MKKELRLPASRINIAKSEEDKEWDILLRPRGTSEPLKRAIITHT